MVKNDISYIKAYTEFNCLLEYLPQSYIDKIPKKLIELIKTQASNQYNIEINTNKPLAEQNFSKRTKDLIAVIKYNYWSTSEEQNQFKRKLSENEEKYQKELLEKYNYNELFNKKETKIQKHEQEDTELIEYKENKLLKLLNKIKKIFGKKKRK